MPDEREPPTDTPPQLEPEDLCSAMFKRHVNFVRVCLGRMGFCREDARDLAQETFLRVYQGMETYQGGSERAWLARIARNVGLNDRRRQWTAKRGFETSTTDLDSLENVPTRDLHTGLGPRTGEERALWNDTTRRLHAAIQELPARYRIPLVMRIPGTPYAEIGAALGLSPQEVKEDLRVARRLLRLKLGEDPAGIDWPEPHPRGRR
jgi:RNA polymerase sigma factor (sigma-70 family)